MADPTWEDTHPIAETTPKWEDTQPASMAPPMVASAAAGAIQSVPFSHQLGAIGKTGADVLSGVTPVSEAMNEYRNQRDLLKTDLDQTAGAHPVAAFAGSLPAMAALPLGAGAEGMAAYGAAQGLANSPADLTKGEIGPTLDDTIRGGATGAVLGKAGELAGAGISKVAQPVADYLRGKAGKMAVQATKVPGITAYNKFPENAGETLLDRGIVGFGDTQAGIAKKATAALDESGQKIGGALSALDEQGGKINQSDIITRLRDRAKILATDPSNLSESDGLIRLADRLEQQSEELAGPQGNITTSLSNAEKVKRGFQNKVNYNGSPLDNSVNQEAANIYRQTVEDQATQMNPDLASQFTDAKKEFGALAPIEEATARKASVYSQGPALNLHALRPGAIGAAVGGEEGYRHGGIAGGLAGAATGAILGPRVMSSAAAGTNWLSQAVKASPQSFGKWSGPLERAALRGGNALGATDYMLQQTDPEWREHRKALQGSENQSSDDSPKKKDEYLAEDQTADERAEGGWKQLGGLAMDQVNSKFEQDKDAMSRAKQGDYSGLDEMGMNMAMGTVGGEGPKGKIQRINPNSEGKLASDAISQIKSKDLSFFEPKGENFQDFFVHKNPDGEVQGALGLDADQRTQSIKVDPEARGQGIASGLYQKALDKYGLIRSAHARNQLEGGQNLWSKFSDENPLDVRQARDPETLTQKDYKVWDANTNQKLRPKEKALEEQYDAKQEALLNLVQGKLKHTADNPEYLRLKDSYNQKVKLEQKALGDLMKITGGNPSAALERETGDVRVDGAAMFYKDIVQDKQNVYNKILDFENKVPKSYQIEKKQFQDELADIVKKHRAINKKSGNVMYGAAALGAGAASQKDDDYENLRKYLNP